MPVDNDYNSIVNKLVNIEDKFNEIEPLIKTLNIWIKENDYQLIPIMNMLNDKMGDLAGAIKN